MEASPNLTDDPGSGMGFPQSPSEFDSDPRISFSKLDNKFILETDEGAEYEYDNVLKRWIPSVGLFMPSAPVFCPSRAWR